MATRIADADTRASQFLTDSFQRGLAHWNRERLEPTFPTGDWQRVLDRDVRMQRLEGGFLEELREEVQAEAAAAPTDVEGFIAWFEDLKQSGPGQHDVLFPWLAEQATLDQMRWFFEQEAAGEAGFDDLVAMTQVKLPTRPKLELARNYWDEMGRGNAKGMHGPMLDALVDTLEVDPVIENTLWQSLCLGDQPPLCLAFGRRSRRYRTDRARPLGRDRQGPAPARLFGQGAPVFRSARRARHQA
jgi:hypothetical protein